jgi:hypothetical protein
MRAIDNSSLIYQQNLNAAKQVLVSLLKRTTDLGNSEPIPYKHKRQSLNRSSSMYSSSKAERVYSTDCLTPPNPVPGHLVLAVPNT